MENISIKRIETDKSAENKLIVPNKRSDKLSIFEEILLALKNSSNKNDVKDKDLLRLEKFIKISDNTSKNDKNIIKAYENSDIKNIDIRNVDVNSNTLENITLENSNFVLDISNINNNSFRIKNIIVSKNENLNSLIGKEEKIDQKVKFIQKNLLSNMKIFENVEQEKAVNEIKKAKSIDDILNIVKKYRLNLKNIEIKKDPTPLQTHKSSYNFDFKIKQENDVNNVNNNVNKKKEEITLNRLLQKKEVIKDKKIEKSKNSIKINVDKKEVIDSKDKNTNNEKQNLDLKDLKNPNDKRNSKNIKADNSINKIADNEKKLDNVPQIKDESRKVDLNLNIEKKAYEIEQKDNETKDKKDLTTNEKVDQTETKKVSGSEEVTKPNEIIKQKVVNAKQTVLSFAKTLQEQVENYKPPFTRMQLSLDPEDLGKVDVTLISRGKNLHIQVNSNPTAIGVMAVQGNELRNQLNSMGFTDVQMQFNMNQQQQQQQNSKRHMYSSKEHIDIDEIPQDYESLEIILPNYA